MHDCVVYEDFVLEEAKGELFTLIQRLGRLSNELARFFAAEITNAMSHVHGNLICHRDLKPENLLLSETNHIKLTDFGTSKVLDGSVAVISPRQTSPNVDVNRFRGSSGNSNGPRNSFVGTAEYVAPEVLKGDAAGFSADFWSFGCILYQMLCGRPPFKGASEYLTFQQILSQQIDFPDYISDDARNLINELLINDPQQRLGCKQGDQSWLTVQNHPFFSGVDFQNLYQSECPPFEIPAVPLPAFPLPVNPAATLLSDEV